MSHIMQLEKLRHGTELIKRGFARMQKGGVIMDVTTPEQARIAEEAGAVAVMALHAVPADTFYHIDKTQFTVPFVCGARNLGEALRRINEGAAMIRTKGEAGTGDVSQAVKHMKQIQGEIRDLAGKTKEELIMVAREIEAPIELVIETSKMQRLPVVNFAAGGVATPADAALMMRLGADGVFVGSGIFKAENPAKFAKAIVGATAHYDNPSELVRISKGLGGAMKGIDIRSLPDTEILQA